MSILVKGKLVLIAIISLSTLSVSKQIKNTAVDNISNSHWKDYQKMYPHSPLCKRDEITLWTCKKAKKIYSLCSSNVNSRHKYIQYRVAYKHRLIFKYPTTKLNPKGLFKYNLYSNGNAMMEFYNKDYKYELVDSLRSVSQIYVFKKSLNKQVSTITCKNSNQSLQLNYTIKLMSIMGIDN